MCTPSGAPKTFAPLHTLLFRSAWFMLLIVFNWHSTQVPKQRQTTGSILLDFNMWCVCITDGINRNMETTAGEDVDLRCPGTSANDPISSITWMRSNGSIVFNCDKSINPCTNINARHTLEGNITFISTVTIRNVSLIHEDDYHFVMLSPSDREICQINLTVYGIHFFNIFI